MSIVTTTATDTTTQIKVSSVKVKKKFEPETDLHLQHRFSSNELTLVPTSKSCNVFNSTDLLQYILKVGNVTNTITQPDSFAINNEICMMIQDTISHESISRLQLILSQMDQLKFEEKLLLYLKLPASLINPNVISDPLKQPLNPLGNRYEIHQTIMWIKTHLEEDPEVSLPKQDVYDEYNIFCSKNNMKPLSTADFGKVMKQVYPRVRPRRLGTRGNSRYCYAGMRKKLILKPPILPSTYDETLGEAGEYHSKEDMLGAASTLIREWAETYFNIKFPTLCTLGKYLVDNLFVDNQSLAAVCIMSSSQPSSRSTDTESVSCQKNVSGKITKLRDTQLQLQRKIQQRDQKHRDLRNFQFGNTYNCQINENIDDIEGETKKSRKDKEDSSQSMNKDVTKMLMKISKISIPSNSRKKKILRADNRPYSSLQSICDNLQVQLLNDKQINLSNSLIPWCEKISFKEETSKKTRKRANSCAFNLSEIDERIPDKLLKLIDKKKNLNNIMTSDTSISKHRTTSVELQTVKTPVILSINPKAAKNIKLSDNQPMKKCDKIIPLCSKNNSKSIGRSDESDSLGKFNTLSCNDNSCLSQKQLGLVCNNALEDYLNINNSQEQEEELLQYFRQSSSSSSDTELNKTSEVVGIPAKSSRQDKVSQLRIILQENLKDLTPMPKQSSKDEILNKQLSQQYDKLPNFLLSDQNASRRRVSFDIKLTGQCARTGDDCGSNDTVVGTPISTAIPSSPNTRRRIFNFTPISPTPSHSPITTVASKCNSADGSPFVSPRNTPMPRSRSNLQKSTTWRVRSCQKQHLLRSASSCNVNDFVVQNPFIVPTTTTVPATGALTDELQTFTTSCIAHPFLSDLTSQEPQLLINYPSQENLQEIKDASEKQPQPTDQEISDLLLNEKQLSFAEDQTFYRSQSVPLHRMVNPALLSPILTHQLTPTPTPTPTSTPTPTPTPIPFISVPQNSHISNSSSVVPTPVSSDFSELGSTTLEPTFSLDDKQISSNNLNIFGMLNIDNEKVDLSYPYNSIKNEEQEKSNEVITDSVEDINETVLISDSTSKWFDNAGACTSNNNQIINAAVRSIYPRSYPNTPLPLTNTSLTLHCFDDSNASKSYPTTPIHSFQQQNSSSCFYMELNEPMLCSPTLGTLTFRDNDISHVNSACPTNNECNDTDFLEPHLPNNETDDLDSLTNFDQLQDVDTLAPLFNEVAESNN